jgi:hypothetical protein
VRRREQALTTPTKARAAISRTAVPIPSVPWTMSGVTAFGMTRRIRIPAVDSPRAREATT